ncbi:hypothetical protein BD289DRAFT_462854 [Coniella lustricola]|uniref:Hyaluronan/mRNA-binding protein domain-containing protein n=1 Tax=Coniella lustricola TaxID=2025994 RepID=A0A2T2ZYQ9_9PEZI|nr:hypothetical protein BD289DRAFT_462854 [Coniella lustricola]
MSVASKVSGPAPASALVFASLSSCVASLCGPRPTLLGNDVEGSETPKAPVKTVTKSTVSTAKTTADGSKPASQASRAGFSRSQQEFRDNKGVGRAANQNRSTEERTADRPRGGRGARGRGGAGATRHRNADDRHAKNIAPGSEKQAAQSWGATDGNAELKDEQAGEAIAETEKQEADAEEAEAESKEPEPKQVTLDAYYAERDAAALNEGIQIRKVSDVPDGVQVQKEEAEDYFAATGGKSKKTKNKKVKETIAWEDSAPREERDTRGPRGGGPRERGGRGDGPRGGRGGPRGGGGAPRGGFPRGGPRGGGPRGGRGAAAPNLSNTDDFPSLG